MNIVTKSIVVLLASGLPYAHAKCFGEGHESRRIYEVIALVDGESNGNGQIRARIKYYVSVSGEVCEEGTARLMDNRTCVGHGNKRFLVRSIEEIDGSGMVVRGLADVMKIEVPVAPRPVPLNGSCNARATQATTDLWNTQIGNTATWMSQITDDMKDATATLAEYGSITSETVTYKVGSSPPLPPASTSRPAQSQSSEGDRVGIWSASDPGCIGSFAYSAWNGSSVDRDVQIYRTETGTNGSGNESLYANIHLGPNGQKIVGCKYGPQLTVPSTSSHEYRYRAVAKH